MEDFYVDDLLSGANTLEKDTELQSTIREIMASAELHLRKWAANNPNILLNVPDQDLEKGLVSLSDDQNTIKTLGIWWNHQEDYISFKTNVNHSNYDQWKY